LIAPVEEIQGGDAVPQSARRLLPDLDDSLSLRVGQRFQEQPVDEAEDGDVGAEPQGQCQHREQRESGVLQERPPGVSRVGQPRDRAVGDDAAEVGVPDYGGSTLEKIVEGKLDYLSARIAWEG
jgi:hypothetical protein